MFAGLTNKRTGHLALVFHSIASFHTAVLAPILKDFISLSSLQAFACTVSLSLEHVQLTSRCVCRDRTEPGTDQGYIKYLMSE